MAAVSTNIRFVLGEVQKITSLKQLRPLLNDFSFYFAEDYSGGSRIFEGAPTQAGG